MPSLGSHLHEHFRKKKIEVCVIFFFPYLQCGMKTAFETMFFFCLFIFFFLFFSLFCEREFLFSGQPHSQLQLTPQAIWLAMEQNWLHPVESSIAQTHWSAPAYRIQGADPLCDKGHFFLKLPFPLCWMKQHCLWRKWSLRLPLTSIWSLPKITPLYIFLWHCYGPGL